MSEHAVEIQSASDIDYPAYAAFQRDAYRDLLASRKATDAHMTSEYYRWKYHTPDGMARVARVADECETVSSSAMLPLRISVRGKSVTGWHCLDVATLPKARRRGCFLATLQALKNSIPPGDLLFAFPNASSIGSFLKLGCVENDILTTWISPCVWLVRRRDPRVEIIDGFGPEHDIVGNAVEADRPLVSRRPEYLNWRYTDHPNNDYVSFVYGSTACEGICVVRGVRVMGRDLALVMEIFGTTPRVQSALLSHAADWAHAAGLGTMAVMSTSLTPGIALRAALAPVPSFLLPKRQVLVIGGAGDLAASLMTEAWAVQTGDWDVF
jgi:hypothetical protein